MSRRQRCARRRAVRSRVAWAKLLRRRARETEARRTASVAIAAAVTLAGVGVSTATATTPTETAVALKNAARSASASPVPCDNPQYDPSDPGYLTDVSGELFFAADDGIHGSELWKSDGTTAGTVLVKDIRAGGYGSELED